MKLNGTPWRDGIRFECQGSGKCCTSRGQYGYVYVTLEDRQRFAKYFKLPTAKFTKEYCGKHDGHYHLKNPESDCVFLKDKRCGVYEARPVQCRTWPFWKQYKSVRAWNRDVVAFCPGVGKGRLITPDEIAKQLAQDK